MSSAAFPTVTCLRYHDVAQTANVSDRNGLQTQHVEPPVTTPPPQVGVPEGEVQARIAAACFAERLSTEQRLGQEHARQYAALKEGIAAALDTFVDERFTYFARVESEVVHLALAVARKILQREAQLDPLLLAGLVRIALDGMQSGPAIRLRVSPDQAAGWNDHEVVTRSRHRVEIQSDPTLVSEECVLETDAGSARLSYETQLKEVERGFLDLLGQRPDRLRSSFNQTALGQPQ